jgi:hypothetical protein
MQRILLVVAVLLLVWRVLAAIGRRLVERAPGADSYSRYAPAARRRRRQWSGNATGAVEDLVECAECGTFVPAGRALGDADGRSFCSHDCCERAAGGTADAGR